MSWHEAYLGPTSRGLDGPVSCVRRLEEQQEALLEVNLPSAAANELSFPGPGRLLEGSLLQSADSSYL